MKILLTGATGFIGSSLAKKLLQSGHEVSATTRNLQKLSKVDARLKPVLIDLTSFDASDLQLSKYDLVFNCAGELNNPESMRYLHVDATTKMLSTLHEGSRTRWIQLSSVGVYGPRMNGVVTESSDFNPVGEYEITKAEADSIVKKYCLENTIPFSIIRPSNVFGNDMPNRSLWSLIKIIQRGFFFYMDDPDSVRANYVHIDDVVSALITCGFHDNSVNEDFIISDSLSQRDFVLIICESLDVSVPKLYIPQYLIRPLIKIFCLIPKFPLRVSRVDALTTKVIYSTKKIETLLSFKNRVGIETGLNKFITQKK